MWIVGWFELIERDSYGVAFWIQGGQDSSNVVRKTNMQPVRLHTCMCLRVYTVYTYVHALYMCMQICMCVYIHTCMHVPMDARMHVSICIYTLNLLSRTIYPATPQNVCVSVGVCEPSKMYACRLYVWMHVGMYACIYTHMYVRIYTCTLCIYTHTYICIRVYIYAYTKLCMYIYTRTHMCVCMYTNIKSYIYSCIHTKYSLKNNLLCCTKHTVASREIETTGFDPASQFLSNISRHA